MIIPDTHTSAVSSSFIYGDINQNSDIDLSDITLVTASAEGHYARRYQLLAADVKYDGNTDILDAASSEDQPTGVTILIQYPFQRKKESKSK